MNEFELLVKLHVNQARQGPGSEQETLQAAALAGLTKEKPIKIADIGAGTGASTLTLANHFNCTVEAIDFLPEFVASLKQNAAHANKLSQINAQVADMAELPFEQASFDVIWSEGAVYNMGFERGISAWRDYLKVGGKLAVSEITWLTEKRPAKINEYWQSHYPEIAMASEKIKQLEQHGYKVLGYFPLSKASWLEHYYLPLQSQFETFLTEYAAIPLARSVIEEHREEIALYQQYQDYFSYGFYVAEKL